MKKYTPDWVMILGVASFILLAGIAVAEIILYIKFWGIPFNELPGWVQWLLWFLR